MQAAQQLPLHQLLLLWSISVNFILILVLYMHFGCAIACCMLADVYTLSITTYNLNCLVFIQQHAFFQGLVHLFITPHTEVLLAAHAIHHNGLKTTTTSAAELFHTITLYLYNYVLHAL